MDGNQPEGFPVADTPVHFIPAQVFELDGPSYQGWSSLMRDHLELRDCWDVVEYALSQRDTVEEMLKDKTWARKNVQAKIHMKHNLSRADLRAVSTHQFAGDIWMHLFKKYGEAGPNRAVADVLDWEYCAGMPLPDALADLEQRNQRVMQYSPHSALSEPVLITLFLEKLPNEYLAIRNSLKFADRNRNSFLQALKKREELFKSSWAEPQSHVSRPSVDRTPSFAPKASNHVRVPSPATSAKRGKSSTCHNCGEAGHIQRFCPLKSKGQPNGTHDRPFNGGRPRHSKKKPEETGGWDAAQGEAETGAWDATPVENAGGGWGATPVEEPVQAGSWDACDADQTNGGGIQW